MLLDRRTLLAALAASTAAGAAPRSTELRASNVFWSIGHEETMRGFMALPARARGRQPAVIVVHDASGLDQWTREFAMRVALAGPIVLAPDFLSPAARTPTDPTVARAAVDRLDWLETMHHAELTLHWLRWHRYTTGRVAAIGIGWGATLVERLAELAGPDLVAAIRYDADWAGTLATLKERLG